MRRFLTVILAVAIAMPAAVSGSDAAPQPICPSAKDQSICYLSVPLKNLKLADINAFLPKVLASPGVKVIGNEDKKSITLVGTLDAITSALTVLGNLPKTATPTPVPTPTPAPMEICAIDGVAPAAATTIAGGITSFLNGSLTTAPISTPVPTPTPTAGSTSTPTPAPAASMNFTAKNGSVIIDSSETRILVHAPSDAMDQLKLALKKFTNQAPSAQVYRTYEVHYAVPDPIPAPTGTAANGAISLVSSNTLGNSSVQELATAVSTIINQSGQSDVRVTPDTSYPRILLAGSEGGVNHAIELLQSLDRKPAIVELKATVFNTDDIGAKNLGMTLPTSISASVGAYVAPGGTATASTPAPIFAGKIVTAAAPTIAVQLNTLIQLGAARVVSYPQVATLNGRLAVIDVGQVIPFVSSSINGVGTFTSNVNNYVIGTHLEMIPYVNYDGSISVYVHPINSTLTGFSNQNAPLFERREVSASYRIQSGQAVFISGLTETQDNDTRGQTPFINLIPFFGKALFGSHTFNGTKTHLTIELTAKILDPGELDYLTPIDGQTFDPSPSPPTPVPNSALTITCISSQKPTKGRSPTTSEQFTPAGGGNPTPTPEPTAAPAALRIQIFSPQPLQSEPPLQAKDPK